MRHGLTTRLAFGASLLCASSATPCTVSGPRPTATELVDRADVIVVAVARELVPMEPIPTPLSNRPPDLPAWLPTPNQPARPPRPEPLPFLNADPRLADHIRFEVTQTLKGYSGKTLPIGKTLLIQGRFSDRDDFNDTPVPWNSIRSEGGGPCYASTYRRGAAYILLLRKAPYGQLSPYWAPLSRLNDQIRPGADQWLEWVRQRVAEHPASR